MTFLKLKIENTGVESASTGHQPTSTLAPDIHSVVPNLPTANVFGDESGIDSPKQQ